MRTVQRGWWLGGWWLGLAGQLLVLLALAATVGLGAGGWLCGLGWGVAVNTALWTGLARSHRSRLGPANRVTLVRATLAGALAALVVDSGPTAMLVPVAVVTLGLDWVDGRVARATGSVSALGARFDMEVDAFVILVLSIAATPVVGAWVLVIGAARYLLLAAGATWTWLRRPSPPRPWAKVVAAVQGVALTVAVAGALPTGPTRLLLLGALGLLAESFGRQVWWLHRHRPAPVSVALDDRAPAMAR